jgi:hypothetical protein
LVLLAGRREHRPAASKAANSQHKSASVRGDARGAEADQRVHPRLIKAIAEGKRRRAEEATVKPVPGFRFLGTSASGRIIAPRDATRGAVLSATPTWMVVKGTTGWDGRFTPC